MNLLLSLRAAAAILGPFPMEDAGKISPPQKEVKGFRPIHLFLGLGEG